jgi:cellulose synthase/poly-beta-1,6-N-acetylglucosamine synthase-like glycosyltransferase
MVEINIKTVNYNSNKLTGTIFTIDRLIFDWKDLDKNKKIKDKFLSRRLQSHYLLETFYNKPTFLQSQVMFDEDYKYRNIIMSVCLPCYDEEWSEVSGTLRSLSKNILIHRKRPDKSFRLHVTVFIIQDGWNRASKSFKEGIVKEFGCIPEKLINKYLDIDPIVIIVPDTELYYPSYNNLDDEQNGITFYPIFITKNKNSHKFNSHLIFFSLCYLQKPDCVFLTDCGTLYDSDCLYKLVEYLYKKKTNVIGVTARQKVMNRSSIQEIKEYPHWWSTNNTNYCVINFFRQIEWWFSIAPIQGFEFESTFLLNTSIFNMIGALPVLPGPCQLLWWNYLESSPENNDGVLDIYFHHLNMNINNSGIIKTNTLLVEDRILSFSMILRTFELKTIWVEGATFSYEPMITWGDLLSQRRRWNNGTMSTYMYYLLDEKGKDEFSMSGVGNNRPLQLLWVLQLYQSFLQMLSPCFFTIALFESFLQITEIYPNIFSDYKYITPSILSFIYFGFYILWIFIAMIFGKKLNCYPKVLYKFFMELVYNFYALINSIISIFIIYNIVYTKNGIMTGPVFWILLFIWIIPFLLSFYISFLSAFSYIIYSLPYFINIIQYVCFVPAFSIARLHDISWGNRDCEPKITNKKSNEFLCISLKLNFLIIIINLLLLILYEYIAISCDHLYNINIIIFAILFMPIIIQYIYLLIYFIIIFCVKKYKVINNEKTSNISVNDRLSSIRTQENI